MLSTDSISGSAARELEESVNRDYFMKQLEKEEKEVKSQKSKGESAQHSYMESPDDSTMKQRDINDIHDSVTVA